MIIIAIVLVILIGLLIFSRDFRRWLGDTLQAIALLIAAAFPAVSAWLVNAVRVIGRVIGIYSLILAGTTLFALVLIIVALIINAPAFTAFAFVLALTLVLLAWLPAGIVLKLFRINNLVIPKLLKMIIAWVAFVGFLGLMCPDIITFRSLMGAALIGFILLGVTTRINALDKIVFPLVVVMCLTVAWKHFFPEDFRSASTGWRAPPSRYQRFCSQLRRPRQTASCSSPYPQTECARTAGSYRRSPPSPPAAWCC